MPPSRIPGLSTVLFCILMNRDPAAEPEWVRVADDKRTFALDRSGERFVPWGFNYDHDEQGRPLEDYGDAEWPKVAQDFREMRQLRGLISQSAYYQ